MVFGAQYQVSSAGMGAMMRETIWDRHRKPQNLISGQGRNIVITGGNRGIGFEAVKVYISLGYHVIIGCRNPAKCNQELEKMREENLLGEGTFEVLKIDLMSLDSVREFATEVLDKNLPIHILANNAGIMLTPNNRTKEGFESQLGVNHLAHFVLTSLLLPRLREASTKERNARIVNISSVAHCAGYLVDWDDVNQEKSYDPNLAYGVSKCAQVLCCIYLDKMLKERNENIMVNCFHPGVVDTGLYENYNSVLRASMKSFMRSAKEGSDCLIFGGASEDLEGKSGLYIDNCREKQASAFARNVENQKKMWEFSLQVTGIKDFFAS